MKLPLSIGLLMLIASTSQANEVPKDDWINGMSTVLPASFCKSNQYFRQCFNVTERECEEAALSTTRICLAHNKNEIPTQLKQPEDGTRWGSVIGGCAGLAYELILQEKRISNCKCDNPANWQ